MSDNSSIEWTRGDDGTAGATWNPVLGCDRVSPGCDACYAITQARIREANPSPKVAAAFAGLTEHKDGRLDWTGRVNLLPERLMQPTKWRKPRRVFVNSLADLFHDDVPDEFIDSVFAVMADCPQHTFQLLTKRHARMRSYLSRTWPDPLPNVWVGVSVEDQKWADIRVPALLGTPAAVRWLSCEPLLGPVDLTHIPAGHSAGTGVPATRSALAAACKRCGGWGADCGIPDTHFVNQGGVEACISWVVAGGESGPGARPMHPDWARRLQGQCTAAEVPFFFKQWGAWSPLAPLDGEGRFDWRGAHPVATDGTVYKPGDLAYPDGPRCGEAIRARHDQAHLTNMYRVGKKAAGRELDGCTYDGFPETAPAVSRA